MEDGICLDTDFLVNFLRRKKEEVDFIKENEAEKDFAMTFVNAFELYYGAYKSGAREQNLEAVARLLERIPVLESSHSVMKKAGEMLARLEKEGKLIDFRDLFIGAAALTYGYGLKTGNVKHFEKINGLKIV